MAGIGTPKFNERIYSYERRWFEVHFNGRDPYTGTLFEEHRGVGAFERASKGAKELKAEKPSVKVWIVECRLVDVLED